MIETNYYAKVSYRGKEKDYRVVAELDNDIRIEYLDYNPEREFDGVWINNGKERILEIYLEDSEEHKYYESLNKEWNNQVTVMREQHQRIYKVSYASLGTWYYKKAWRLAVNVVNEQSNLQLFPNQKIRG